MAIRCSEEQVQMKKRTLIQEYKQWKIDHKRLIKGTFDILMFYGVLFFFAVLASADAICDRWFPFCSGWF